MRNQKTSLISELVSKREISHDGAHAPGDGNHGANSNVASIADEGSGQSGRDRFRGLEGLDWKSIEKREADAYYA